MRAKAVRFLYAFCAKYYFYSDQRIMLEYETKTVILRTKTCDASQSIFLHIIDFKGLFFGSGGQI